MITVVKGAVDSSTGQVPLGKYIALLLLSLELVKELRNLCNDDIHHKQMDNIMDLIAEVLTPPAENSKN